MKFKEWLNEAESRVDIYRVKGLLENNIELLNMVKNLNSKGKALIKQLKDLQKKANTNNISTKEEEWVENMPDMWFDFNKYIPRQAYITGKPDMLKFSNMK